MTATVQTARKKSPHQARRIYPDAMAGAAEKTRAMAAQGERAFGQAVGAAIAARRRLERAVR